MAYSPQSGRNQPVSAQHFGGTNFRPPTPSSGFLTANPYGALRPQTGSLAGPSVPGTAMRPGSSLRRVPTPLGAPPPSAGPVGLTTEVKLSARPVTSQGLGGAPLTASGPGRQIADRSYYLGQARGKIQDIGKEIRSMTQEIQQRESDTQVYARLERTYEDTVQDVRALEGQLADFNLALDKLRTNTEVSEIADLCHMLRERNAEERATVDDVFMSRQDQEKKTQHLEQQLEDIREDAAASIREMGEDAAAEYENLQSRNSELSAELQNKQKQLAEVESRVKAARHTLQSDAYRTHARGVERRRQREQLLAKKQALQEELQEHLSPEEMREKLLRKVKEDTADIRQAEQAIAQLEQTLENYQDEIRDKESEVEEMKKHAAKSKKYQALFQRDRAMQEFIDGFPDTMKSEQANKQKVQQTIVALLDHISKGITRGKSLPDSKKLAELKQELTFKEQKMSHSKQTLDHLQKERAKRKAELEKINTLDEKISKELVVFRQKIARMQAEMAEFQEPEILEQAAAERVEELKSQRDEAKRKRDAMRDRVKLLSHAFDKIQKEAKDSETAQRLERLENKLRTFATRVFQLSDYIAGKRRESDYAHIFRNVTNITQQINALHIQRVA